MKKYFLILLIFIVLTPRIYPQKFHEEKYINQYLFQNPSKSNKIDLVEYYNNIMTQVNKTSSENSVLFIDSIITLGASGGQSKVTLAYDEQKRISSFLIFSFYDNSWENSIRVSNTYNSSGKIDSILQESWNGNDWENWIHEDFIYSNGNEVQHIIKELVNNNWENWIRVSNTFDSTGNMITSLNENWINGAWTNTARLTNEYYLDGLRSFELIETWNNEKWEKYVFITSSYDDNWKLDAIIVDMWNGSAWSSYIRTLYTYNSIGPQVIGTIQMWDNNEWTNYQRFFNSYNSENYFTEGVSENWENNNWVPGDGELYIDNPDGFELAFLTYKMSVYYKQVVSVKDEEKNYVSEYQLKQNYPNPFNPSTTINYSLPFESKIKIDVYNITGQKIKELVNSVENSGMHQVQFNSDGLNLSSGIYFYSLEAYSVDGSGSFRQTKKMILLK